jgi:RNA polymerase sigma-70 factor (ECF subfamily)
MSSAAIFTTACGVSDFAATGARDEVIARSLDRLMCLTRRMLRGFPQLRRWEETDDVFQEAAIRLYRALGQLAPRSTSELLGLAALQVRRSLIDLSRQHFGPQGAAGHYRSDPALGDGQRLDCQPASQSHEPQSLAQWTAFHEAVEGLPDDERRVFELVWYGGATYCEAADVLGIARRSVIRRMNRARLRLAPAALGLANRGTSSDVQLHSSGRRPAE